MDKGLTVPKCVLINQPEIPQMHQNLCCLGFRWKKASLGVRSSCDQVFCCNCFWEKQFGYGVLIQLYRGGFAYQMTFLPRNVLPENTIQIWESMDQSILSVCWILEPFWVFLLKLEILGTGGPPSMQKLLTLSPTNAVLSYLHTSRGNFAQCLSCQTHQQHLADFPGN